MSCSALLLGESLSEVTPNRESYFTTPWLQVMSDCHGMDPVCTCGMYSFCYCFLCAGQIG